MAIASMTSGLTAMMVATTHAVCAAEMRGQCTPMGVRSIGTQRAISFAKIIAPRGLLGLNTKTGLMRGNLRGGCRSVERATSIGNMFRRRDFDWRFL